MNQKILLVWKQVFSRPAYILTAIIISLGFYLANAVIQNYQPIFYLYKANGFSAPFQLFIVLAAGFHQTLKFHSLISLIISSILLGVLISLIIFKISNIRESKKIGFAGTLGIFFALLAPGCAACGIGIVALLGLSSTVIAVFPYDGLELSILAIIILSFAIFKTSKDLAVCEVCQIDQKRNTYKAKRR